MDDEIDILGDSDSDSDKPLFNVNIQTPQPIISSPMITASLSHYPSPSNAPLKKRILDNTFHPNNNKSNINSNNKPKTNNSNVHINKKIKLDNNQVSSSKKKIKPQPKRPLTKKAAVSKPDDKKSTLTRSPWSKEQQNLFLKAIELYKKDYKKIQEYIGTKTLAQVRSHAQKHFKKLGNSSSSSSSSSSNSYVINKQSNNNKINKTILESPKSHKRNHDLTDNSSSSSDSSSDSRSDSSDSESVNIPSENENDDIEIDVISTTPIKPTPTVKIKLNQNENIQQPQISHKTIGNKTISSNYNNSSEESDDNDINIDSDSESEEEDNYSKPIPILKESVLNKDLITQEEIKGCCEFFTGASSRTPERYIKIRNKLIEQWNKVKPHYLTITNARNTIKDCGDVNSIGRVHKYLESVGVINFNSITGKPKPKNKPINSIIFNNNESNSVSNSSNSSNNSKNSHSVSNWNIRPGEQRKKKIFFDGDWVDPSNINELKKKKDNKKNQISEKKPKKSSSKPKPRDDLSYYYDPFVLIPCCKYSSNNNNIINNNNQIKQPFTLDISSNSQIIMDVHSHISKTEVIGMLAGKYYADRKHISISMAIPCKSISSEIQCEMDPNSLVEARELITSINLEFLGWYHSHPNFDPLPSMRDIETQTAYQKVFGKDTKDNIEPFIGVIVNPYYQNEDGILQEISNFKYITISGESSEDGRYRIPYELSIKKTVCHSYGYLLDQLKNIYKEYKDYAFRTNLLQSIGNNNSRNYLDKMIESVKFNIRLPDDKEDQTSDNLIKYIRELYSTFTTGIVINTSDSKDSKSKEISIDDEDCDIENVDEEIDSGESSEDGYYYNSDDNTSESYEDDDSSSSSASHSYNTNDFLSDNEIFNISNNNSNNNNNNNSNNSHNSHNNTTNNNLFPIIPTTPFFEDDTNIEAFTNNYGNHHHHHLHHHNHHSHHSHSSHPHLHHPSTNSPSIIMKSINPVHSPNLIFSPLSPSSKIPLDNNSSSSNTINTPINSESVDIWLAPF